MLDTVLRDPYLVDGTGGAPYRGDVGIAGGRIVAIGDLAARECRKSYSLSGYCLTPGFIDLHTHSELPLLLDGRALSFVLQGVTTQVIGNCGFSPAPLASPDYLKRNVFGYQDPFEPTWTSFGEYLEALKASGLAANVAPLVGHAAIRSQVMGYEAREAGRGEVDRMVFEVDKAMDEGALGLSTGLEYAPGIYAAVEEQVRLCRAVAKRGGLYATHVRNRDEGYRQGYGEAFRVGRRSGVRLQISHAVPKHGAPDGAAGWLLEELHRAGRDAEVHCDLIPYEWGPTSLTAILPADLLQNTPERLAELLSDGTVRSSIVNQKKPFWLLFRDLLWDRILVYYAPGHPELAGRSASELGVLFGTDPFSALLDLLVLEGQDMFSVLIMGLLKRSADLATILQDSRTAVVSDALSLAKDGPLRDMRWSPGCYGWVPHLLENYVGEGKLLPLEEGIRRLTSLPAAILGIRDRGQVAEGLRADLTAFRLDRIGETATLASPSEYARGFDYTWCNGTAVVEDGVFTGARPGEVLSRS